MPYLPPPRLVGLTQVLQLAVARDEMLERDQSTLGEGVRERERSVEVGEGAIDQTDAAERVGSGEIGRGERGHIEPETMRSGKVKESYEEESKMDYRRGGESETKGGKRGLPRAVSVNEP